MFYLRGFFIISILKLQILSFALWSYILECHYNDRFGYKVMKKRREPVPRNPIQKKPHFHKKIHFAGIFQLSKSTFRHQKLIFHSLSFCQKALLFAQKSSYFPRPKSSFPSLKAH